MPATSLSHFCISLALPIQFNVWISCMVRNDRYCLHLKPTDCKGRPCVKRHSPNDVSSNGTRELCLLGSCSNTCAATAYTAFSVTGQSHPRASPIWRALEWPNSTSPPKEYKAFLSCAGEHLRTLTREVTVCLGFLSLAVVHIFWKTSGEGGMPEDSCWSEAGLSGSLPHALAFWPQGTVTTMPLALFLLNAPFQAIWFYSLTVALAGKYNHVCCVHHCCSGAPCSALPWPCEPGCWSLPLRLLLTCPFDPGNDGLKTKGQVSQLQA